jgi:hypothetical protein
MKYEATTVLKTKGIALLVVALSFTAELAAQEFTPGNRVDVRISAEVEQLTNSNVFVYRYTVSNGPLAEQKVWRLEIIQRDDGLVQNPSSPAGWFEPGIKPKGRGYNPELKNIAFVGWGGPPEVQIAPGSSLRGFDFSSTGSLSGIVDYYAEGYAPPPSYPGSVPSDDPIPGYDDITPYGPGVVGRTIGPIRPPVPLIPAVFVDYLISQKHEAFALGWIKHDGLKKSLDAKLDSAKAALIRGQGKVAQNTLRALLNEVEAQRGKGLTSEAYALFKYNLHYLTDNL